MRYRSVLLAAAAGAALIATHAAQAAATFTAAPTPVLDNGSFETPGLASGAYVYSDAGTDWTFGGALVNAQGSSAWYGGTPPSGVDGHQLEALQGGSSLSQSFTATSGTMDFSWLSGGRPNMGAQNYTVSVGGHTIATVSTTDGSQFVTESATASGLTIGQTYTLNFQGLASTDQTAFIDRVEATQHNILTNGGFEAPNIGAGNYSYSTAPVGWTSTGALVNAAGASAWYGSQAPAGAGGVQFVALQGLSTLSQTFYSDGSRDQLEWLSAGRPNYGAIGGDQSYEVLIDGTVLGAFDTTDSQPFQEIIEGVSGLTAGEHTLTFQGLATTDQTAFIDNVSLSAVPEPASWAMMLVGFGLLGAVLRGQLATNRQLARLQATDTV